MNPTNHTKLLGDPLALRLP